MQVNRPKAEEKIIKFWKKNQIFEKSLDKKGSDFVFYEGPPTANAQPGVHHVLARVYKDIICRYQTMQGKRVLRKAGWDVHGLPVELAVEKELGLKNKKEIEKYGVDNFNQKCKESVWKYAQDWTNLTERIAFWLDLENPYITSDPFYMETVFNIIKQISDKGLLYQDYKVVPYCPRCGTGLSSHEVAQGYKKIKEPAIYLRFKIKEKKFKPSTYLLVWTTTPWTLPGNVAIAVNPKITYILAKIGQEYLIVAKERREVLGEDFEIIKELKGKELVGLSYEPLFDKEVIALPQKIKNINKVLAADFVTTEEGTGLVHIAPAFGQDDMELIKAQSAKRKAQNNEFPILLTVDEEGKFKKEVKKWTGMFVKEADPLITKHLQETGCLFKQEQYEHDYPFCWRCGTPLLYYAKKSWFIKATAVKEELIRNNKKINWLPSHIKEGRFGEWLNELKDWALSRERYWGTPLPIWKCEDCEHQEVIGGREDFKKQKFSTNKYFVLRHGESFSNTKGIYSAYPENPPFSLTEEGAKQVGIIAQELKKKNIDLIFSSDLLRTKETAEIIGKLLAVKPRYDERLRELGAGIFNGKPFQEVRDFYDPKTERSALEITIMKFTKPLPRGETYSQARERILDIVKELNRKYQNKNILIVSHECPITMLETMSQGMTIEESADFRVKSSIQPGELRELDDVKIFPYNRQGELDFHRPHIDQIEFLCPRCGKLMRRVPEVIDCWFDSGSMPFAQGHWPFAQAQSAKRKAQKISPPSLFPADYISEAVDQTRGWFYTLLAISTLLGFESPYKNVIVLGLVLDEKGQKMSKSKGNVVDPWQMVNKYGADALRWYFFTINQPWDVKLFNEKDLDQRLKKFVMTFWNCYVFWETYKIGSKNFSPRAAAQGRKAATARRDAAAAKNILDKWILSRLNELIEEATEKLDKYDITAVARLIDDFVINDLSLWYIRRSRKRFQKPDSAKQLEEASSVLGHALLILTKLTAPFVPLISEEIYLGLADKGLKQSVHLDDWPKPEEKFIDKTLEEKMNLVRRIVNTGLKLRSDTGIKVRQPLKKLKVQTVGRKVKEGFLDLIKEELNVKEVEIVEKIEKESGWIIEGDENLKIALNTELTVELKEEGLVREVARQIQEMRKGAGCKPEEKITIYYSGDKDLTGLLARNKKLILSQVRAKDFISQRKEKQRFNIEKQFKIDGQELWLGLKIVVR